jgi:hypothetical protein
MNDQRMTQQQKSETKISRNNLQSLFALDKTSKMQQAGNRCGPVGCAIEWVRHERHQQRGRTTRA